MNAATESVPPMKPIHHVPGIPSSEARENAECPSAPSQAAPMISSLEKKPAKGGTPAMASVANSIVQKVTGRYFRSPPMLRMSCASAGLCVACRAWCMEWITAPEPRKRHALKKACVIRWKTPATYAPIPTAANMKPSCDTVE
jgi:hypothetical protein